MAVDAIERGSLRTSLMVAGAALIVSRLVVWAAGIVTWLTAGVFQEKALAFDPSDVTRPFGELGNALIAPAARWDSIWYLEIARDWYSPEAPNRSAFFPLYPLLVRVLTPLLGEVVAGIFVAFACFFLALALFHRLALLESGSPRAALLGTFALALFPGALWFSAVYSESLFLLLSVGAVLAARERRWLLAAVAAALAATTRSAGVLLAVPIALLWWDARREARAGSAAGRAAPLAGLLAAPAVLLGLLATCVVMARSGPGFFAPFDAQKTWGRTFEWPWAGIIDGTKAGWAGLRQLIDAPPPIYFPIAAGDPMAIARHNFLLWLTLIIALVLTACAWRMLRPAHALYATLALMLPLSYPVAPQPLMSLPRFASVLYPLFIVLGIWLARGSRVRAAAWLIVSAGGLAAVSALFVNWRWVA